MLFGITCETIVQSGTVGNDNDTLEAYFFARRSDYASSRANKYNEQRFHNDPFASVTYIRDERMEGEIGKGRGLKAFTFCLRAARSVTGWRTHSPRHDRS